MSFLRAQSALNGCSCERRGTRARGRIQSGVRGGLGAADPVAAAEAISAGASKAVAAAAPPAVKKQVMYLQAQLNRFGAGAPVGFRFVPTPLAVDGILSVDDAAHAVAILQWRYANAIAAFPGETVGSLAKLQQVTSQAAVLDPVGYVLAGLPSVTSLLQKYADANGLPAAAPISLLDTLTSPSTLLVVGLAAAAFYLGSR
jgi:hypothetical protein